MEVKAVKTPLAQIGSDIQLIIAESIKHLSEESIVVIASKIFSFCEMRIVQKKTGSRAEKYTLVRKEAEYYLDPHSSKYNLMLTIKKTGCLSTPGLTSLTPIINILYGLKIRKNRSMTSGNFCAGITAASKLG